MLLVAVDRKIPKITAHIILEKLRLKPILYERMLVKPQYNDLTTKCAGDTFVHPLTFLALSVLIIFFSRLSEIGFSQKLQLFLGG